MAKRQIVKRMMCGWLIYKRNNSVFNPLFVFGPKLTVFCGATAVIIPFAGEEENYIVEWI